MNKPPKPSFPTPPSTSPSSTEEECDTCDVLQRLTKMGLQKKVAERSQPKLPSSAPSPSSSSPSPTSPSPSPQPKPKPSSEEDQAFWEKRPPPDMIELGNSGWTLLHTIAAYYPKTPTPEKKKDVNNFLVSFSKVFPCRDCAKDFEQVMHRMPPNLNSQEEFADWMCRAHNQVNIKLGKPEFDCSKVQERWRATFHHKEDGKP